MYKRYFPFYSYDYFPSLSTPRTGNGQVATSFYWIHGCKSELREDDNWKRRKGTHQVKTVDRIVLSVSLLVSVLWTFFLFVSFDSRRNLWTETFSNESSLNDLLNASFSCFNQVLLWPGFVTQMHSPSPLSPFPFVVPPISPILTSSK